MIFIMLVASVLDDIFMLTVHVYLHILVRTSQILWNNNNRCFYIPVQTGSKHIHSLKKVIVLITTLFFSLIQTLLCDSSVIEASETICISIERQYNCSCSLELKSSGLSYNDPQSNLANLPDGIIINRILHLSVFNSCWTWITEMWTALCPYFWLQFNPWNTLCGFI